mmetsp:Transcript_116524/g.370620  ORF Transcript_116524/g.370620 Transcript_116524/m.370620 type:complete len:272 (+) Transcript_116524:2139-2954(+)
MASRGARALTGQQQLPGRASRARGHGVQGPPRRPERAPLRTPRRTSRGPSNLPQLRSAKHLRPHGKPTESPSGPSSSGRCRRGGLLRLHGLDVARLEAGAVLRSGLVEGVLELPEARGRGQALVPVRMAEDALGHGPMHRKVAGVTLLGVAALRHDGRELGEVLQVALEHRLSVVGAPPADAHQLQRAANEAEHRGGGQGLAQTREERAGEDASARLRNLHRVADTVVRLEVERLQEVGDLGHGCCGSRVGLCASCCDEAASLEAFDPELP